MTGAWQRHVTMIHTGLTFVRPGWPGVLDAIIAAVRRRGGAQMKLTFMAKGVEVAMANVQMENEEPTP